MVRELHAGQILWRHIVWRTKESKTFFFGFMGVCLVVPWAVAEGFMWAAKRNQEKLKEELRHAPFGITEEMTKVNKARLQELLDDVKNRRDINDRYATALRGKIMTGPPEARVVQRAGTTMPMPPPAAAAAESKSSTMTEPPAAESVPAIPRQQQQQQQQTTA